jgi:hypothetical protein
MKRLGTLLLGAAALAVAQGCSKEPALYLGGPPGPATNQVVSNSNVTVMIGDSAAVGARAEDAVGNATADAVTLSTCNAAIATVTGASSSEEWSATAFIKGAGMGSSCVLAQSGGLTDTISVTVGPAGVAIVGPDTVGSGNTADYTVVPVDMAGTELTGTVAYAWSSSNTARLVIDADAGTVAGKSTGAVDVRVFAPGGANAKKTVTVAAGVFGGALSATSAAPGVLITATRAAGADPWDTDTQVQLAAVSAYVDSYTSDALTFAVPATGSTAAATLGFLNIGPNQLAQNTTFTATKADADVYSPANLDYTGAVDVDVAKTAKNNIYLVSAGTCAGGAGAACDHFFKISAGASDRTVTATVTWSDGSDVDILWTDEGWNDYVGNFNGATSAKPEVSTVTIPANTTWLLWINMYTNGGPITNLKLTVQ